MLKIILLTMTLALVSLGGFEQSQSTRTPLPSFEVASIKPTHSSAVSVLVFGNINPPPGPVNRFVETSTARRLIQDAYNIQPGQLTGGPSWITSERYEIDAKVPDSIVADAVKEKLTHTQQLDEVRVMLRSLLADRFQLKLGHITKQLPVDALVVAKGGPKLTPVTGATPPPPHAPAIGQQMITVFGPVSAFVNILPLELDGRVVVDRTGLKGDYLWAVYWTSDDASGSSSGVGALPALSGPSIFAAIQEQLGLKLESTKGPVEVLVIEHIERPSPN